MTEDDAIEVEIVDPDEELTAADLGGSDVVVTYEDGLVAALPELARLAAAVWARGAAWGLQTSLRAARATVDPQALREYARELLGINELEERLRTVTVADRFVDIEDSRSPEERLRAQGAELLRQSADVSIDDRVHPAFGRILSELAPDEGRILRLLWLDGPQPVVDVRAANLIGVGSQLVAPKLNMVGMQAGCRHPERVPAYLTNLARLGLVRFTDEPVGDAVAYQVLEAQPDVLEAIKRTARARSEQRSLRLTEFGSAFCEVVLPAD